MFILRLAWFVTPLKHPGQGAELWYQEFSCSLDQRQVAWFINHDTQQRDERERNKWMDRQMN